MIPETTYNTLQELIKTSTMEEIIWINGYLNGLVSGAVHAKLPDATGNGHLKINGSLVNGNGHLPNGNALPVAVKKMTIAYGTETGNSKKLALQFSASAKKEKLSVKCVALEQYRLEDLDREDHFFLIISTHGEGEPPETAKKFIQHIEGYRGRLDKVQFSVLALGDSSYPLYCKTGEDVDQRLFDLGAKRVVPLVKCDVDFEEAAAGWYRAIASHVSNAGNVNNVGNPEVLGQALANPAVSGQVVGSSQESLAIAAVPKKSGKKNYEGRITKTINLNDRGSLKETYHIEIVTDEALDYEPGDSIAIIPSNNEDLVNHIINKAGADANEVITSGKYTGTVKELLLNKLNICHLLTSTVKKYADLSGYQFAEKRMDLVDLLRLYPLKNNVVFVQVLGILNPIAPRLYSVSSAVTAGDHEVHITVSRHKFQTEDEEKFGLCSSFLGDLPVNSKVIFYIHRNRSFKLPSSEKDIIMVGPGTGIAPFRSFLVERDLKGDLGRNWLFFGEQHFQSDFLYQTEIQQYLQTGVLHKVSLAFSRDQQEKIYVQHRMLEQGDELYKWLTNGAVFYVAGTKDPMSIDVEKTLLRIIAKHGQKTEEEAIAFLDQMKKEERYHKDVY